MSLSLILRAISFYFYGDESLVNEWAKIIHDHYDLDSKKIVFSMMCEIICADGLIDPFESNFIRRLSGLLYISDKEAGIIKKQVMKEKDMQ